MNLPCTDIFKTFDSYASSIQDLRINGSGLTVPEFSYMFIVDNEHFLWVCQQKNDRPEDNMKNLTTLKCENILDKRGFLNDGQGGKA